MALMTKGSLAAVRLGMISVATEFSVGAQRLNVGIVGIRAGGTNHQEISATAALAHPLKGSIHVGAAAHQDSARGGGSRDVVGVANAKIRILLCGKCGDREKQERRARRKVFSSIGSRKIGKIVHPVPAIREERRIDREAGRRWLSSGLILRQGADFAERYRAVAAAARTWCVEEFSTGRVCTVGFALSKGLIIAAISGNTPLS